MLPNFLIVGGARCGTTALYHFLKQHPKISFPKLKEPRYFSSLHQNFPHQGPGDYSIDKAIIKDYIEYKKLFSNIDNELVGEASPDYLYFYNSTAEEIYNHLGDIKIIIILRNPVNRAFSAYNHLVRDNREKISFQRALNKEEERMKMNYDFMWFYKDVGLYYNQVKTYRQIFSNVLTVFQENLKFRPEKTMKNIFHFLGVENYQGTDYSINYNTVGKPKNRFAKFILNRNNKVSYFFRESIKKTIPRNYLERISNRVIQKQKLDDNVKDELYRYFHSDIEKLENLLGSNLDVWKRFHDVE